MTSAATPRNEKQRLEALYAYEVLDSEAEDSFDELARLAADICGSEIALVSLVDAKRQWFKARVGTDISESPRDIAACAHAINQTDIFEVSDAAIDERFYDNPLVVGEPHIRFYAGAPLITPEGHAVGTLCVIDKFPRSLSGSQRKILKSLSTAVVSQLELRLRNKELKRINQFRSDFISYISHELRTPLNAVVTFAELLEDKVKAVSKDEDLLTKLGYIRYSGERILSTVNSVLELNKIEAGKMQAIPETVNTLSMLGRLEGIVKAQAEKKGLTLIFNYPDNMPAFIRIDESKFVQVALNLASNAIKYTDANKRVTISTLVQPRLITLIVEDTGCGISKEEQHKLFKQYQRLESAKNTEGTGLGLVITKGLVELMDGQIFLKSEPDKGTTVEVMVPFEESDKKTGDDLPRPYPQLVIRDDPKILAVEDNAINQVVVESVFNRLGLSIDMVDSGEECLNKITQVNYDLVLMDIRLPGISGLETTRLLHARHPELPVVALTADVVIDDASYKDVGITKILTKPINQRDLINTLNYYLA